MRARILNSIRSRLGDDVANAISRHIDNLVAEYKRSILEEPKVRKEDRLRIDDDEMQRILSGLLSNDRFSYDYHLDIKRRTFAVYACRNDAHGEDAGCILRDSTGRLVGVIVCDGVSETRGALASNVVTKVFKNELSKYAYGKDGEDLESFLDNTLRTAVERLADEYRRRHKVVSVGEKDEDSATTLLLSLTDGENFYIYYLGDGYIYYFDSKEERLLPYMIRYKVGTMLAGYVSAVEGLVSKPVFLKIRREDVGGDIVVVSTDGADFSQKENLERYNNLIRSLASISEEGFDPIKAVTYHIISLGERTFDDATIGFVGVFRPDVKPIISYGGIIARLKAKIQKTHAKPVGKYKPTMALQPTVTTPTTRIIQPKEPVRPTVVEKPSPEPSRPQPRSLWASVIVSDSILKSLEKPEIVLKKVVFYTLRSIADFHARHKYYSEIRFIAPRSSYYTFCDKTSFCILTEKDLDPNSLTYPKFIPPSGRRRYPFSLRLWRMLSMVESLVSYDRFINKKAHGLVVVLCTDDDFKKMIPKDAIRELVRWAIRSQITLVFTGILRDFAEKVKKLQPEFGLQFDRHIHVVSYEKKKDLKQTIKLEVLLSKVMKKMTTKQQIV